MKQTGVIGEGYYPQVLVQIWNDSSILGEKSGNQCAIDSASYWNTTFQCESNWIRTAFISYLSCTSVTIYILLIILVEWNFVNDFYPPVNIVKHFSRFFYQQENISSQQWITRIFRTKMSNMFHLRVQYFWNFVKNI